MSREVTPLELGSELWVPDWADGTPAMTREAQHECGPGEWRLGEDVMLGLGSSHSLTSLCPQLF